MTHEEWWAQMTAHFAASDEERRRDQQEFRRIVAESQRHIDALQIPMPVTDAETERSAASAALFDRLAEEALEQDRQLGERIEALVSAIGALAQKKS
jgi:N-glycosylase/DNA lyase